MPFPPNSALREKISSEVIELARLRYQLYACGIFFASLDFGKNCYSRTASCAGTLERGYERLRQIY